jgi:hypothetical protein
MPTLTAPPRRALKGIAAAAILGVAALTFAPGSAAASLTAVPGSAPAAKVATSLRPSFCDDLMSPNARSRAAKTRNATYLCTTAGDLVDVRIGDVHATQPSLGYDEVYYKLGRYSVGKDTINKKYDDWCEANGQEQAATVSATAKIKDPTSFTCTLPVGQETPASIAVMKTVVIGPKGSLYLTDGHHTLTSFYETAGGGPDTHVRLRVLGNLSKLDKKAFWTEMQRNQWVWLRDVEGTPIKASQLPSGVGLANFADDRYRSILYFARDIGYTPGSLPFQEFYWGSWVRDGQPVDLSTWNQNDAASYLDAVKKLSVAQTSVPASTVIDGGFTAAQLGVLPVWNAGAAQTAGEFAKLSKPYSDAKPGKIAYALQYKLSLPR